jgi:hypothetical protein
MSDGRTRAQRTNYVFTLGGRTMKLDGVPVEYTMDGNELRLSVPIAKGAVLKIDQPPVSPPFTDLHGAAAGEGWRGAGLRRHVWTMRGGLFAGA